MAESKKPQPKKNARRRTPGLRPIGVTPDGSALLLARSAGATTASFRLPIDEALVGALEDAHAARKAASRAKDQLELPPLIPGRVESSLTIAEIQNLLRQGRSVAAIARKAGVDPSWIERWETPIVWERAGTATKARRAHLTRSRGGVSKVPLGEAVIANLKARGLRLEAAAFDAAWDSIKKPRSDRWVVSFSFTHRGREQTARWEFDHETSKLVGLDKVANELAWVEPPRRRKRA